MLPASSTRIVFAKSDNMAVFYFAQERSINFARVTKAQAFWIQAADSPPNWFCNGYSPEELEKMKKIAEMVWSEVRN